jgi:putative transposase
MNLPRSTYYHKSKNRPDGEQALIARIGSVIEEFPGYGYRRVSKELHRRGFRDNHKKVLRVMKRQGLTRVTSHIILIPDSHADLTHPE